MIAEPRIYADFHGEQSSPRDATRIAVPLDTFGSLRDLSNAGIRLREGIRLVIYADSDESEDLEADCEVYYSPKHQLWFAELDSSGVRYTPCVELKDAGGFLCVHCRQPLSVAKFGRPEVGACPTCGSPVDAAIAPPKASGL